MNNNDILIVAAHSSEVKALVEAPDSPRGVIEILHTGVGGMNMSWALQKRLHSGSMPHIVINAGIAGSYSESAVIGEIVIARSECFADLGIDDNGKFISLFSAGLLEKDTFPFTNGRLMCDNRWMKELGNRYKIADAATVNMASGSEDTISRIKSVWNPATETMEGAWCAYICMMSGLPWINVRAVSNKVEPRNVKNWDIDAALRGLKQHMPAILKTIQEL